MKIYFLDKIITSLSYDIVGTIYRGKIKAILLRRYLRSREISRSRFWRPANLYERERIFGKKIFFAFPDRRMRRVIRDNGGLSLRLRASPLPLREEDYGKRAREGGRGKGENTGPDGVSIPVPRVVPRRLVAGRERRDSEAKVY